MPSVPVAIRAVVPLVTAVAAVVPTAPAVAAPAVVTAAAGPIPTPSLPGRLRHWTRRRRRRGRRDRREGHRDVRRVPAATSAVVPPAPVGLRVVSRGVAVVGSLVRRRRGRRDHRGRAGGARVARRLRPGPCVGVPLLAVGPGRRGHGCLAGVVPVVVDPRRSTLPYAWLRARLGAFPGTASLPVVLVGVVAARAPPVRADRPRRRWRRCRRRRRDRGQHRPGDRRRRQLHRRHHGHRGRDRRCRRRSSRRGGCLWGVRCLRGGAGTREPTVPAAGAPDEDHVRAHLPTAARTTLATGATPATAGGCAGARSGDGSRGEHDDARRRDGAGPDARHRRRPGRLAQVPRGDKAQRGERPGTEQRQDDGGGAGRAPGVAARVCAGARSRVPGHVLVHELSAGGVLVVCWRSNTCPVAHTW